MAKALPIRSRLTLLIAVLALVVQSMLASVALASAANTPTLDAFGNPLCITSDDGRPGHPQDSSVMPGCCLAGCIPASSGLPTPDTPDASIRTRFSLAIAFTKPAGIVSSIARQSRPGNPRAPPVTLI